MRLGLWAPEPPEDTAPRSPPVMSIRSFRHNLNKWSYTPRALKSKYYNTAWLFPGLERMRLWSWGHSGWVQARGGYMCSKLSCTLTWKPQMLGGLPHSRWIEGKWVHRFRPALLSTACPSAPHHLIPDHQGPEREPFLGNPEKGTQKGFIVEPSLPAKHPASDQQPSFLSVSQKWQAWCELGAEPESRVLFQNPLPYGIWKVWWTQLRSTPLQVDSEVGRGWTPDGWPLTQAMLLLNAQWSPAHSPSAYNRRLRLSVSPAPLLLQLGLRLPPLIGLQLVLGLVREVKCSLSSLLPE